MPDNGSTSPNPPKLPDPGSTPRPGFGYGGGVKREPPIFDKRGDSWQVTVTPLLMESAAARAAGIESRAVFEVRAEFDGEGLPEFEPLADKVRRVDAANIADQEEAVAVALMARDELRAGREPDLVALRRRFTTR